MRAGMTAECQNKLIIHMISLLKITVHDREALLRQFETTLPNLIPTQIIYFVIDVLYFI